MSEKTKHQIKIGFFAAMFSFLILAYQNCGVNNSQPFSAIGESHSGSGVQNSQLSFTAKLYSDFQQSVQLNSVTTGKCDFSPVDCESIASFGARKTCNDANVQNYYAALACKGFQIAQLDNCIFAISSLNPQAGEFVQVDGTCVQLDRPVSLHLAACTAEEVGFGTNPSTGIRLSSWLDFTASGDYQRQRKTVQYHNLVPKFDLGLYLRAEAGNEFKDACGKSNKVLSIQDVVFQVIAK